MISRARALCAALACAFLAAAPMAHAALTGPVKTTNGMVSGVKGEEPGVTVFQGIPVGQAPVGNLRWKAPQPVKSWKGVRKADQFGLGGGSGLT